MNEVGWFIVGFVSGEIALFITLAFFYGSNKNRQ